MNKDRIVAIALLTRKQLDVLGSGLKKVIPVTDDDRFDALIKALDEADSNWRTKSSD